MERKIYKVNDRQFEFLRQMRSELYPLDDNDDAVLVSVLTNRKYNEFQARIIRNLRARWIRQSGLHNKFDSDGRLKYEDQLNSLNRRDR